MKTRALLLALPVLALVSGCRDNRASISIQGICAPPDSCTFSGGGCEAFYVGYPTLDVGASANDAYSVYVQLDNQTPDNADENVFRTNTNDAFVDETVVEFSGLALPRSVLGTLHRVPAGGSTVIRVEVIPDAMNAGAALAAYAPASPDARELLAKLTVRGYWGDGSRFETGEFPISIRICSGCVTATNGLCPTAATCPPNSNGQLPIACL